MNERKPMDVIEIRAVKNGFVISAFEAGYAHCGTTQVRGHETRVVQVDAVYSIDHAADRIRDVIRELLTTNAMTTDTVIPPARALP